MIQINRSSTDKDGNEIKPDNSWFESSRTKTQLAIQERSDHEFDGSVYAHEQVRMALEELFHRKCAYCESSTARYDLNVEHFRPKGKVAEREDHPGYYWLAYEWDNLYPSCVRCNQRRKARPLWGGTTGTAGGKLDQFPVDPEVTRAMDRNQMLANEKYLILDPCRDEPEEHLRYDLNGKVYPNNKSRRAGETIRVLNLSEPRLCLDRKKVVKIFIGILRIVEKIQDKDASRDDILDLIGEFTNSDAPYAGLTRYIWRNPIEFGIKEDVVV